MAHITEKLELELLTPEVRTDTMRLNELIADDFWEVGAAGKAFGKEAVLEHLPQEPASTHWRAEEMSSKIIREGVSLVTFTAIKTTPEKVTKSYRSSLWVKQSNQWQMLYHQGTLLDEEG